MTGRSSSRNGSALLIVLGMLSFMVISAVAFSMFMRESRLPSSFLRQKLVANHLVKAALANAMNEIDAAIGSNPYPGVTASGTSRATGYRNEWQNRVFTGKETEYSAYVGGDNDATVPTLTLEALAYLPPPLINTVRYMSRHTPTALWHPLKYDAGRYAYTAVNVSDYLDINRLRANVMRDSSPSNRVSMTYFFENETHTGPATGASPEMFDAFIKKVREDGDYNSRLVSLADYNLAIGSSAGGSSAYGNIGFKSPFLEYFSGQGDGMFYADVANDMDAVKRQQFVTDSWYPGVATNNVTYLTDDNGQPFDGGETFYDITKRNGNGTEVFKRLRKQMDGATLGALCDYVDEDDIPISLAIPTIERAPMLTGIYVMPKPENFRLSLKTVDKELQAADPEKNKKRIVRRTWMIDTIGDGKLLCDAHGVYPFYRSSGRVTGTYKAQMLIKAFFSDKALGFDATRLSALSLRPTSKSDWKDVYAIGDPQKAYMTEVVEGTVTINNETVNVNFSDGITFDGSKLAGLGVYGLKFTEDDPESGTYDSTGLVGSAKESDVTGLLHYYTSGGGIKAITEAGDVQLKLNFAVYVRLLDNSGKTVDLVPARLDDDIVYNDLKSKDDSASAFADDICGDLEPVLPMTTSALLDVNLATFRTCAGDQAATPALSEELNYTNIKIFCDDPRFNYAPEDWYTQSGDFSWSEWESAAKARCDGAQGRQSDIYQFVSDCGYLQSMGELQFLPNLDDVGGGFYAYPSGGGPQDTSFYNASKYNGKPLADRTSPGSTANNVYAWRTHWAFGPEADWADGKEYSPYNWGILDAPDGFVVTPYSTNNNLLMAGFANTPYDWTVAGLAADGEFNASDVKKYCFNGYSGSEAPLAWDDLEEIADNFRERFSAGEGWSKDLGDDASTSDQWNKWWSTKEEILGVPVDNIHDVDRKFLYSYWKGCFGDRQQLFLIFVRAEPSSMGAGVGVKLRRSPSQLGARAVALVWREPVASISSSNAGAVAPHRMRILFYHQFE